MYKTDNWVKQELAERLAELYRHKFKREPFDTTLVALGFDGMQALLRAAKRARDDNESLQQALIRQYGETRSAEREQKIFQIIDGRGRLIQ